MKVSMKDERLARSLLWNHLIDIGFPERMLTKRVAEAWPGMLKEARDLNAYIKILDGGLLDGRTTQEEVDKWTANDPN